MPATISVFQWVILGSFLSILLPLAAGWRRYRQLPPSLQNIFWFCVGAFLLDACSRILWLLSIPNLFFGHISTLVEFLFLTNAFRLTFGNFISSRLMYAVMAIFSLLAIANSTFLQDFQLNNSYIKILESAILILLSLTYYYKLILEMKVFHLERHPFFWINTAILIYFSSSLFVFIYSNYLLYYSHQAGIQIWFIHSLFFILFNCILSIGLWIVPKNSNLSS